MAESILLLIILLIIIAISIGIYLYTQQNTTDDKTFSDREQQIIDKAIKNTQPIITTTIDTKLDDSNYVRTDDLTFSSNLAQIITNKDKIEEITTLRTNGDSGDITVGPYQYIMQDTTDGSANKIELRNKVNIANDFNICNETQSVCYKFTVEEENLNIVKINSDGENTDGGKIYFKNAFELYDGDDTETDSKYVKGPHPLSINIATPSALNDRSFETQKSVYNTNSLRKQFLISNAIAVRDDDTEKTKQELDDDKQYYIKINTGDGTTNNYKYHIMYPFSKLLQPILEYDDGTSIKTLTMDYLNDRLTVYTQTGDETLENTIPTSIIQVNANPQDDTAQTLTINIKYIKKEIKRT